MKTCASWRWQKRPGSLLKKGNNSRSFCSSVYSFRGFSAYASAEQDPHSYQDRESAGHPFTAHPFEYLLLLLHPTVAELTNHTPVLEMLIFVSIAAILIPGHHRIEAWLIKKLIHRNESIRFTFKKTKYTVKKSEE